MLQTTQSDVMVKADVPDSSIVEPKPLLSPNDRREEAMRQELRREELRREEIGRDEIRREEVKREEARREGSDISGRPQSQIGTSHPQSRSVPPSSPNGLSLGDGPSGSTSSNGSHVSTGSTGSTSSTFSGSGEPVHPNAKTTSTKQSNGSVTTRQNMSTPICKNCKTQTTPLWRRDESGQVLCNACGLFLKLHGRPRPISLKSDVIKSRNRVKHNNSSKSSPNTPELKAKDSRAKFSSKQYRPKSRNGSKKTDPAKAVPSSTSSVISGPPRLPSTASGSPALLPLLPRNQNGQASTAVSSQTFGYTPSSWSNKQQQGNQAIHSLHYPSSTPAQFASNLARVTSPLLLSSTAPPKFNASQSSERSSSQQNLGRDAVLNAAGALETLSQQNSNDKIPGMRLDAGSNPASSKSATANGSRSAGEILPPLDFHKPYSPSTELNGYATPPLLPTQSAKLPSLDQAARPAMSPSFGASPFPGPFQSQAQLPQVQIQEQSAQNGQNGTEKLPPLKNLTGHSSPLGSNSSTPSSFGATSDNQLQQIQQQQQQQHHQQQQQQQQQHQMQMISPMLMAAGDATHLPSISRSPLIAPYQPSQPQQRQGQSQILSSLNQTQQQSQLQGQRQPDGIASNEELRTRISELELVNDLYKTRIIELEAMDNAAKQREMLLKKRIDDLTEMLRRRKEYHYGEYGQSQSQQPQSPSQAQNRTSQSSQSPQPPQSQPGGDLKRIKVEQN
ncbi:DEKNAAC101979 [Brettanomyces naardenensis]|uniref:DEKNAAC101979 n=1 Tax=Brettanomyces naardenensis TaxID=13370 RepID=A0A448YJC3_BRENA|nr:DEKNAAC101979 [Brettanomyces naardenensis]